MTKTIERVRTFPPLPEIDDATRREFLLGAAGLLLLAPYGCGSSVGSGGEGGSGPSGETRVVEHAAGRRSRSSRGGWWRWTRRPR